MTLFSYDLSVKSLFTLLIICSNSDLSSLCATCNFFFFSVRNSETSFILAGTLNITSAYISPYISSSSLESFWISFIPSPSILIQGLSPSYWPLEPEEPSSAKKLLQETVCFLTQILDWLWNCFQKMNLFPFVTHEAYAAVCQVYERMNGSCHGLWNRSCHCPEAGVFENTATKGSTLLIRLWGWASMQMHWSFLPELPPVYPRMRCLVMYSIC